MPLPTCQCVAGLPTQQQLGFIYCALLDILAASGGGDITLSQISDMTTFWKTSLAQTPIANLPLYNSGDLQIEAFEWVDVANNAGPLISITASQISDPSALPPLIAGGPVVADGTVTPVTSITTVNGIPTAIS